MINKHRVPIMNRLHFRFYPVVEFSREPKSRDFLIMFWDNALRCAGCIIENKTQ